MRCRAGTCGWSYEDWKGVFYPPGCKDELAHYCTLFDCVEIDSTWYRIPSRRTVESWERRTPEGFTFCPKMPGEITHEAMLVDCEDLLEQFIGAISLLGGKLGPIVVQLAPKFHADQFAILERFLSSLPDGLRYTVEFRHKSWVDEPRAIKLLQQLEMGLVMAHHPWYPRIMQVTCELAYIRLMGPRKGYPDLSRIHRPRDEALHSWAEVLQGLEGKVQQAFVFVNNHFEGHAPASVRRLLELLGQGGPSSVELQPRLDIEDD